MDVIIIDGTMQDIFDKCYNHLWEQNCQSISPLYHGCAYRGKNGNKCAIGALISDEQYSSDLEGLTVSDLCERQILYFADYLADECCFNLCCELQIMHDTYDSNTDYEFRQYLNTACNSIAKMFCLNFTANNENND